MGLMVTGYSHLEYLVPQPQTEQQEEAASDGGAIHLYNANGYDRLSPQRAGWYQPTADSVKVGLDAGPYSEHNRWRGVLSDLQYGLMLGILWSREKQFEGQPFTELLFFGDNEGALGAVVCQKLADDFRDNRARLLAKVWSPGQPVLEFFERYDEWAECLAVGAQQGGLYFH